MDVFCEQLVTKRSDIKTVLLRIGIILAGLILIVVCGFLTLILREFSFLGLMGIAGVGYGAWYLLTSMNIEFEYSLTNGEIDIDKIVAQRKRKRLITVVCKQVESMGKYKAAAHEHTNYKTRIFACEDARDEENTWFVVYNSVNFGKTLVVFNPPEKMRAAMKPFIPKTISYDLQRNGLM
jgi:hypothetical protein